MGEMLGFIPGNEIYILKLLLYLAIGIVFIAELSIWALVDGRPKKMFSYLRPWFLLNVAIAYCCVALLYTIFNHLYLSAFLSLLIGGILVGIHIAKFRILGLPLFFWDYIVLKEPLMYLPTLIQKKSTWAAILALAAILSGVFYGILSLPPYSSEMTTRITGFVIAFVFSVLGFLAFKVPYARLFPANSFRDSCVFKTGLFPFLVLTARYSKSSPPPEGYSKEAIQKISQDYIEIYEQKPQDKINDLPNVVFYSIESLMDLEALGVKLKNHPMPFFNSLTEKTGRSFFVSPTLGGQTVQPEFELLTGLSQYHLSVPNPFVHVIDRYDSFPSLATAFKNLDYYTLGIQAVSAHEFQRRKYYPIIDFDKFIALETDYPKEEWELIHRLLSDNYLVKKIKENLPGDDKPVFGLFLNNSTHASYTRWDRKVEFQVLNNNYSEKTLDVLERYASAINHADQALESLVQHFEKSKRKTIFFIFGDHLPGLTNVFKEMDPFGGNNTWLKFQTPFRIWSNFDVAKKDRIISANFLPILISELLNKGYDHLPKHFQLVKALSEKVDVFSAFIKDKQGKLFDRHSPPEAVIELAKAYDLMQYDMLEGKKYLFGEN